jgi:hypothetical protein
VASPLSSAAAFDSAGADVAGLLTAASALFLGDGFFDGISFFSPVLALKNYSNEYAWRPNLLL